MNSHGTSAVPADPDLIHCATLHPDDGRALRYHLDEQMIVWVGQLARSAAAHPCFETACSGLDRELLIAYLEQVLHNELLGTRRTLMRRQYAASQGLPFDKPVDCPGHLMALVQPNWPDARVPLRAVGAEWKRALRPYLKEFVVERSWRWKYPSTSPRSSRPVVGVELVEGADPDTKCDAFWLANGAFDPGRTLFVLERPNLFFLNPAAEREIIRKMGASAVALHPSVSAGGAIPIWYPQERASWVAALRGRLPRPGNRFERWLRAILRHCIDRVAYWEAFFQWHRVAVFQQFTEAVPEVIAKRMAMQRVGGVEVGKMRSEFFDLGSAAFYFSHQVAFVWHAGAAAYLEAGRTRTPCVVETGYVYDHLFDTLKAEAKGMRKKLTGRGVTRIIAVFDNAPHLDTHFTREQLIAFYDCVIAAAEHNPQIGLLIKSKKPHALAALPAVRNKLSSLESAGRCLIISTIGSPVAVAALASDIAVGFPASTALCEAMLAGPMGLIYDPGGPSAYPFEDHKHGIVFRDLDGFAAALAGLVQGREIDSGKAREIRSQLDPYHDGRSHIRAAGFLDAILQGFESGLAPLDNLRQASGRLPYCRMTGSGPTVDNASVGSSIATTAAG